MTTISTGLRNHALETIHDHDGSCTISELQSWLNISEDEAEKIVRHLTREGKLTLTRDWEYMLSGTAKNNEFNPPNPTDYEIDRSSDEIKQLRAMVEQYPYSGGSQATEMRGAQRVLEWLTDEEKQFDVPGVDERTLSCSSCEWETTAFVHRSRIPAFCPSCGTVDTIKTIP